MRFQRIIQGVSLGLFLSLLLLAAHPYPQGLAANFFLRLDPLIAVGSMVTIRDFIVPRLQHRGDRRYRLLGRKAGPGADVGPAPGGIDQAHGDV